MIQDNTTKWKVRKFTDFASNQALPLGFMYQHLSPIVPVGSLPLLGGTYDRTLYADLWSWANENGLVVSEAKWQEQALAQGGSCSKFSDGNGSTTFRVPALKCWVKGANSVEEVGSYLEAGLPNVEGSVFPVANGRGSASDIGTVSGCFRTSFYDHAGASTHVDGSTRINLYIDASRSSSIYGKSDTVQPPSIVGMWLIVAYGTVTNVGNADVANVMSAVEQVQTELPKKANLGALSMPSWTHTKVSVGTGDVNMNFAAPCDGWLAIRVLVSTRDVAFVQNLNNGMLWGFEPLFGMNGTDMVCVVPMLRTHRFIIQINNVTTVSDAKFVYAQSEV